MTAAAFGPPVAVRVPGDKSITHRALIMGGLATGRSRIRNALVSQDTKSTAHCMRVLGIRMPDLTADGFELVGAGIRGMHEPRELLDCGNSGTTARLLLGALSGCPFESVLTGDESLRSRPMRRVTEPLEAVGAVFVELETRDRLPIAVRGAMLRTIEYDSPRASAQVKSALLMAGLTGGTSARVSEPGRSRDHTERMLAAMGAAVRSDGIAPAVVRLERTDRLLPLDITVPGDFSSAAFILAHAILSGRPVHIADVGINPTRTGLIDVLSRMGAHVEVGGSRLEAGEPVGDLTAAPSPLKAVNIGAIDVVRAIDEIPVLAILAARAEGETTLTGAAELRLKESDRLSALVANLRAVGVQADELDDGLVIVGTDAPLRGRVAAYGDHRIAMAFGVLAAQPGNDIEVDQPDIAAVSFPDFWQVIGAGREAQY